MVIFSHILVMLSQHNDIIMLLICIIQKHQYLQSEKRYRKKKTLFNYTLEILSNKQQLFFILVIYT